MTTTKTLSLIHLEGNIIAVDTDPKRKISDHQKVWTGERIVNFHSMLNYSTDGHYPIVASTKTISLDIPLIREQGVDVRKLATEKAVYMRSFIEQSHFIDGFIAGYHAAPKFGFSREDMLGFAKWLDQAGWKSTTHAWENGSQGIWTDGNDNAIYSPAPLLDKYLASLKQKPTTITIKWDGDKPKIDDQGYVIEIL